MRDPQADASIEIESVDEVRALLGPLDSNTRLIRELHGVNVLVRDGGLRLMGKSDDVERVRQILEAQLRGHRQGVSVTTGDVAQRLREESQVPGADDRGASSDGDGGPRRPLGKVRPKTEGQKQYWQAMQDFEVVFSTGPAGTGKTFLAVAAAIAAIKSGDARRIVLVRPAVEAGEKLGFLPGDFQAKINPYLRPLYDALHDLVEPNVRQRYLESDIIEVCPLAYMRGRTLNDAFIILDEAQNCTVQQMFMFLTRMGHGSRVVVTGDPSQVDLPPRTRSGLADAVRRLAGIDGVAISKLTSKDIVRHPVVQRIVHAYGPERKKSSAKR